MIADTFDNGTSAAVANGEALAGDAAEIGLTARRAIERDVADDDVVLRRERCRTGRIDDQLASRQALADVVVRITLETHRHAPRHEGAKALASGASELDAHRVVRQAVAAVTLRELVAEHRADGAIDVADRNLNLDGLLTLESRRRERDELVVERPVEPVILPLHGAPRCALRQLGLIENLRQIDALGLPMVDGGLGLQAIGAPDHLVHGPEAELRHQLTHVFGDEAEVVLDELRLAVELLAKLRILRRHTDRAGIQVADAHHDAARHDERRGGKAELLGAEERRNHDVAAGLQLPVDLDDDPVAKAVEEEDLLRFREAQLPGDASVLDRRQRRRAGAAVVARNQDDVGVRLRHAGGDCSDTDLGHQLHVDAGDGVGVLEIVNELRQVLDRVDVVVRRRRDQASRQASSSAPWRSTDRPCGRAAGRLLRAWRPAPS